MQRSGSTLLSCLLNQHPEIYATPTSPMLDIISSCGKTLDEVYEQYTFNYEEKNKSLVNGILSSFHENVDKPIIVDKHRGWIAAAKLIKDFYPPKIICTNRSVPEVISSFIKLIENNKSTNNTVDKSLRNSGLPISVNNRSDYIFNYFVDHPRKSIIEGLSEYGDLIHIVEYNDLVCNPQETMDKVYKFLDIKKYNHNFDNIDNTCKEKKDFSWGIENLHVIRDKLQKTSTPPEEVLGKELTEYYSQFDIKY